MRTETRRQNRRTSKHRKRRNRRDEDEIRAWGSENVNNRAIAVRLHAQMIYNNNNNNPLPIAPSPYPVRPPELRVTLVLASYPPWCLVGSQGPLVSPVGLGRVCGVSDVCV